MRLARAFGSLRLRLLAGAALLALLALAVAGAAAWATRQSAEQTRQGLAAQMRMELHTDLSQRISEYAVVAVEAVNAGLPPEARADRMAPYEVQVTEAATALAAAIDAHFADGPQDPADPIMRRATQSSRSLQRVRDSFADLANTLTRADPPLDRAVVGVTLDSFAGQVSPMIEQQIAQDRQVRDAAFATVDRLQNWLIRLAVAAVVLTPILLLTIYLWLVRPLLSRLRDASLAAGQLGPEGLPRTRRDELGLLFARISQTARRLDRRRAKVDADRARLEEVVAERTAELRTANTRLSRIDAERRRFFADVGHELRTPLTVILAETELAQGTADPTQTEEAFGIIRARAQRLNRRIDDLLRLARSETGTLELDRRPVDLSALAAAALDDLGPLIKRARAEVADDLTPELVVEADADWIRQLIGGLIDNALKYAGQDCHIAVATTEAGTEAVLTITDDGPGIPVEMQDKVFDRFARAADEGKGFGVGLALAAWIAEHHQGAISLQSPVTENRGTRITLCLPMARAAEET